MAMLRQWENLSKISFGKLVLGYTVWCAIFFKIMPFDRSNFLLQPTWFMLLLAKNGLGFCSLLAKNRLGFVTCLQKSTQFLYSTNGFCNNHKNQFSFCSSLAKIDLIFVPCKNRLGFYNMHKNRIGSLMDRLGFCCTQNIDSQFYIMRKIHSAFKKFTDWLGIRLLFTFLLSLHCIIINTLQCTKMYWYSTNNLCWQPGNKKKLNIKVNYLITRLKCWEMGWYKQWAWVPGIGDPRTHGDPLSQHSIAYITVNFHT